jgi:hypothetical protein
VALFVTSDDANCSPQSAITHRLLKSSQDPATVQPAVYNTQLYSNFDSEKEYLQQTRGTRTENSAKIISGTEYKQGSYSNSRKLQKTTKSDFFVIFGTIFGVCAFGSRG